MPEAVARSESATYFFSGSGRSGIYVYDAAQREAAERSKAAFAPKLAQAGYGPITTEILDAPAFYFAEDYHQQYLHKNPNGYCNHGPNGLTCPVGVANLPAQTEIAPPSQ